MKHECSSCMGTGKIPASTSAICPACRGTGAVDWTEHVTAKQHHTCVHCEGSGKLTDPCPRCKGSGRFVRGGKDYGPCYACKGKGSPARQCPHCHGRGYWASVTRERTP